MAACYGGARWAPPTRGREGRLDSSKAHIVTLWCAVVSKASRGLTRTLPKDLPLPHVRVLLQLSLPGVSPLGVCQVAHALVMKPDDVRAAAEALTERVLVEARADGALCLTASGRACAEGLFALVGDYVSRCLEPLSDQERDVLAVILRAPLSLPGGFCLPEGGACAVGERLDPRCYLSSFSIISAVAAAAAKNATGLSLTDFRFLLELYPKRRLGVKTLRARDVVAFLRTGRSYVSTASVRLEEQGLLVRVPDEHDARGVLFQLTAKGVLCVQDASEDIYASLVSLCGSRLGERQVLQMLKRLLIAEDELLACSGSPS